MECNGAITEGKSQNIKYVTTYVFEEKKRDTPSTPTEKAVYMKTRNMVSSNKEDSSEDSIERKKIVEKGEHKCTFLKIGYIHSFKNDEKSAKKGELPENEALFDKNNTNNIEFTEQSVVSRALVENNLEAAKSYAKLWLYPEPIPLSSSTASFGEALDMVSQHEDTGLELLFKLDNGQPVMVDDIETLLATFKMVELWTPKHLSLIHI